MHPPTPQHHPETFPSTFWTVIHKAKQKDPAALNDLVRLYRDPVLHFVRRVHNYSPEDAEDIVQEVFAIITQERFLSRLDECKGRFRSILCAVTNNVIRMRERARKSLKRGGDARHVRISDDEHSRLLEELVASHTPTPDQQFTLQWVQYLIARALDRLARDTGTGALNARCFLMHKLQGKSYGEIARELNLKETDVTNYIHAARRKLRTFIEEMIRAYCSSREEFEAELHELLTLTDR